MNKGFLTDLEALINRYSRENPSGTPDFILAAFLADCLRAWDEAVAAREQWYGRSLSPAAHSADDGCNIIDIPWLRDP